MTEDNVTKTSKAQTIKAPSAFNNRYEAIDVVEEGNYKAQKPAEEGHLYVSNFDLITTPSESNRKEERTGT